MQAEIQVQFLGHKTRQARRQQLSLGKKGAITTGSGFGKEGIV